MACGLLPLLLLIVSITACTTDTPDTVVAAAEISVGVAEGSADSTNLGAGQFVRMLTLEGLTQVDPDGRAVPRLAEGWRWEDGGRSLRVQLRPGVRFHDGTPLTAHLASEILQKSAADPDYLSGYPSLAAVTSIEPEGDLEIVLKLADYTAFLPEDLSGPFYHGELTNGTGPYRIDSTDGSTWQLSEFDGYYLGKPDIERVTIESLDTMRTGWAALLRGELDMVTDIPASAFNFIDNANIEVVRFERWYQYLVSFNARHEPLSNPLVRRAMNIAVDRELIIERILGDSARPAVGPMWHKHWAYDQSVMPYPYDPAHAEELLELAGYPLRPSSSTKLPDARFRLTCLIPSSHVLIERLALEIQRELFRIGIDMEFEVLPLDQYTARILDGEFEAALIDMISGPSLARIYNFWGPGSNSGYRNPEIDSIFQGLRSATNDATVLTLTSRLQRAFLNDPPALFIAWNDRARAVRRQFKVHQDPGRDPLSSLWRWSIDPAPQSATLQ